MRKYDNLVSLKNTNLMTVSEFKASVRCGGITNYDGSGFWVKDGFACNDEVFSSKQEDATHVAWYNK